MKDILWCRIECEPVLLLRLVEFWHEERWVDSDVSIDGIVRGPRTVHVPSAEQIARNFLLFLVLRSWLADVAKDDMYDANSYFRSLLGASPRWTSFFAVFRI